MIDPQIAVQRAQERLSSSPTALTPGVDPTKSDVSAQKSLESAQAASKADFGQRQQRLWYGNRTASDVKQAEQDVKEGKATSLWSKILKFSGSGVSIGSAALARAVGKGTESDLKSEVMSNFERGGDYGDVVRSLGVPNYVAAPVGFAMDIGLDPLNWMTMGDAALVPMLGKGLAKGGLEGLGVAAKRGVLGSVSGVLAKTPLVHENYVGYMRDPSEYAKKLSPLFKKVADGYVKADESYRELAHGGQDLLQRFADGSEFKINTAVTKATKKFTEDLLRYNPGKQLEDASKLSAAKKAERLGGSLALGEETVGPEAAEAEEAIRKIYYHDDSPMVKAILSNEIDFSKPDAIQAWLEKTKEGLDKDAAGAAQKTFDRLFEDYKKGDPNAIRKVKQWVGDGADGRKMVTPEEFVSTYNTFKSGMDGWDNAIKTLLASNPYTFKALNGYGKLLQLFKVSAIGYSLPSRVNAVLSNLSMTAMAGVDIFSAPYANAVRTATRIISGDSVDMKTISKAFGTAEWINLAKTDPDSFRAITGLNPSLVTGGMSFVDDTILRVHRDAASLGLDANELAHITAQKETVYRIEAELSAKAMKSRAARDVLATQDAKIASLQASADRATTSGLHPGLGGDTPTGYLSDDVMYGIGKQWVKELTKTAEAGGKGSAAAKALLWHLTKPMENYAKIDQINKIALSIHLANNGVSEQEMRVLQKWFQFGKDDARVERGGRYYLTPKSAIRVADEVYLNYTAMPAFVKIMKNLPIIGAPFLNFTYGMTSNIAKTAAFNTSFFNKVNFLVKEYAGQKNPMEKNALQTPTYNYLNGPSYLRMPFWKKNPIYLNLQQAFPHYSISLLQSSDRSFGDRFGDRVASIVDMQPFMFKDPAGQVLINYVIMPTLIGQAINQAGAPVFPEGATGLEKAGYAASDLVNPMLPRSVVGPVGLIPDFPGLSNEKVLPYVPFTFRSPQYAETYGANAIGYQPQSLEGQKFLKVKAVLRELGINVTRLSESLGNTNQ